jgi:transposase
MQITTIGLDLAKSVCLVGIEACGTSHHWARELTKLGHEVRLMPPAWRSKPHGSSGRS